MICVLASGDRFCGDGHHVIAGLNRGAQVSTGLWGAVLWVGLRAAVPSVLCALSCNEAFIRQSATQFSAWQCHPDWGQHIPSDKPL